MSNTQKYYFAFGSNLVQEQMLRRCPHAVLVGCAKVDGYQFAITGYSARWRGGGATITPHVGSEVWGAVYKIDDDCLRKLDKIEGVDRNVYHREIVTCHYANGTAIMATTYVREPRKLTRASESYRDTILKGAQQCALPESYISLLARQLS